MDLCGFTHPSGRYILGHRRRLTNFGKPIWWVWFLSIVSVQNYGHIYMQIYIYGRFIHWMFGVFRSFADTAHTRRHIPIGDSVVGKGGVVYIAAHSSPTRWRGVALPEMVL